jgi:hypothetical protein
LLEATNIIIRLFPKINDHLDAFNNAFSSILNNHASIKEIRIRNRPTPFVNDEIKQVMKKRDYLHRIFRQSRRLDDWSLFKNASNAAKSMLKEVGNPTLAINYKTVKENWGRYGR